MTLSRSLPYTKTSISVTIITLTAGKYDFKSKLDSGGEKWPSASFRNENDGGENTTRIVACHSYYSQS
jgi:hypothetical protein